MGQPRPGFIHEIPLAEWAHLHSHLIWIYDGPVDLAGQHGTITSHHFAAWLLRKGHVEMTVGNQDYTLRPGEWAFPPSGVPIWRQFSRDAHILSVRFRASWPSGEDLFRTTLGLRIDAQRHPQLLRTAQRLAAFVRRRFPHPGTQLLSARASLETHLRLQSLFAAWLDACVNSLTRAGLVPARMGRIDPRLLLAIQAVERHELSARFSEKELGQQIGLSVSQLNRLFLQQFGLTSHGYMERRRAEYAIAALQGSAQTVKEIAYELGFSSLPHFSSWAKRQLGSAPRKFRTQPLVT